VGPLDLHLPAPSSPQSAVCRATCPAGAAAPPAAVD
jgi:hypothetical protein